LQHVKQRVDGSRDGEFEYLLVFFREEAKHYN